MSVEISLITSLLGVLTPRVAHEVWKVLGQKMREKGVEQLPEPKTADDVPRTIEVAISKEESRLRAGGVRDLTLEAIQAAHDAATNMRKERLRQARITFNAALILTVVGILIIFFGVALLLFREANTAGALTTGVGAVTEIVSAILFRLNHETNNRLDEIGHDLSAIEAARIAMTLIDEITDQAKRDDAISELAKDLRSRGKKN